MILLTAVADVSASCASPFPPPTQGSLCYLSPLRTLFRKAAIGALVCCSCMQQLCVVWAVSVTCPAAGAGFRGRAGACTVCLSARGSIVTVLFSYIKSWSYHQGPPHALVSVCVRTLSLSARVLTHSGMLSAD